MMEEEPLLGKCLLRGIAPNRASNELSGQRSFWMKSSHKFFVFSPTKNYSIPKWSPQNFWSFCVFQIVLCIEIRKLLKCWKLRTESWDDSPSPFNQGKLKIRYNQPIKLYPCSVILTKCAKKRLAGPNARYLARQAKHNKWGNKCYILLHLFHVIAAF